ncbi:10141_t:CDS:1, partial [Cetraspora pellucida]
CTHSYPNTTVETVLKNHFMNKHKDLWINIRRNTKMGGKEKRKQKEVYRYEEEIFTPSIFDNESNYENEVTQSDNQINQDIEIEENNTSIEEFSIVKNIKSIEVYDDKTFKMKVDHNKIEINGRCKIEFK